MSKYMKIQCKYLLLIIWMVAIFILSNEIASISSVRSGVIVHTLETMHVSLSEQILTFLTRKAAHIFMYFVLGILIYNVVKEYGFTTKRTIWLSIILSLAYASSDEVHQLFIQGRSCEVRDMLIDTTAGSVGIGVYYLLLKVRGDLLIKRILRTCPQSHLPTQNHTIPAKICPPLVDVVTTTSPYVEPILTRNGAILVGERGREQVLGDKKKLLKWAYRAVGIALALSYVVTVYAVIHTGMIPTKYLMVAVPVVGLAVLLLVIAQFRRKMSFRKGLIVAILSLLMITVNLYVYSVSNDVMKFLNTIQRGSKDSSLVVKKKTETIKPFVLYISGIDTYGDVATVSRSDVNILVVVNPQTHKILLVNTPRDYYVQLHGTTGVRDKLTHAGIYGIDMSEKTMEDLYGVPIDYYLRINFSSLTNTVDTLNGVDVYSDYDFTAGGNHFTQGYNHVNGNQALAFSRDRHSFESGDRARGQNQQRVIEAIITKLYSPITLLNYRPIILSLQSIMQTNMGLNNITMLINNQLDSMRKWDVESISVDGADSQNYTYSMGNILLYVMEPDVTSMDNTKQMIRQYE